MPQRLILAAILAMLVPALCWAQNSLPVPKEDKPGPEGAPRGDGPEDPAAQALKGQSGWLGVALKLTDEKEAKDLGYAQPLIRVDMVFDGSPAHSSGFEVNDIIIAFEGTPVFEVRKLVELVKGTPPGSKVTFTRLRDGKKEDVPLLLGVRPDSYQMLKDMFLDKPAPPISGVDHATGNALAAAELTEGKVVLVDFWATWCGPCRASLPHIQDMHEKYEEKGLVVIGLTDEDQETVAGFLDETPLPYTIARDEERTTNRKFFVNALPTLFLIDRKGVVRAVYIGAKDFDEVEKSIQELLGS